MHQDTPMPIKFVVLSAARSGTSLLTETLNTHPDIVCHGEIFHPKAKVHLRGTLRSLSQDQIDAEQRDADGYLEKVFDQTEKKAAGFKMWRVQAPSVCDALLGDRDVKKIIYERTNKFAQFSSNLLARATGVWNRAADKPGGPIQAEPLGFNPKAFAKFCAVQADLFAHYRASAKGEVLDIPFSSIADGNFGQVLEFLDCPNMDLKPQKARLHSSDVISRFAPEHHDEIKRTLDDLGHPEWAAE